MRLDETSRLHLGGYLVCHLVDFRSRISPVMAVSVGSLVGRLQAILSELCAARDLRSQVSGLEESNAILGELDTLLTRMSPNRQKNFLMPLFDGRALFLESRDSRIGMFLELLCNVNTLPWRTVEDFAHDSRHQLNEIAGFLFSIESSISDHRGSRSMSLEPSDRARLSAFSHMTGILLSEQSVFSVFREASKVLLRAYYLSEFHGKAAELLTAIIVGRIESKSRSQQKRDILMGRLRDIQSSPFLRGEPHVSPLLDFLRMIEPWDTVEEILLNDNSVINLIRQIETQ